MGSETMTNTNTTSSKASDTEDNVSHHNDLVVVKYRYTALIAFFIGFLTVWSLGITYALVRGRFLGANHIDRSVDLHISQEKIGRVMFSVGQEMCK